MSEPYNFFKRHTLPADGTAVSLNISGSYFRVIEQTAGKFEMSFDGGNFFEFQKGLKLKFPTDGFKKVWFRILTGTTTENRIAFYYGTAEVDDSRLNVIDESSLATIYTRPTPTFSIQPIVAAVSRSATVLGTIPYLRSSDNAQLRSIHWSFHWLDETGASTAVKDALMAGNWIRFGADSIEQIHAPGRGKIIVPEQGSAIVDYQYQVRGVGTIYATYWNN